MVNVFKDIGEFEIILKNPLFQFIVNQWSICPFFVQFYINCMCLLRFLVKGERTCTIRSPNPVYLILNSHGTDVICVMNEGLPVKMGGPYSPGPDVVMV